jgi:hypothetical protein
VTSVYALFNRAAFGHLLPVSGAVKSDWSATLLGEDPLFLRFGWLVAKAVNAAWPVYPLPGAWSVAVAAGAWGIGLSALYLVLHGRRAENDDRLLARIAPFVLYSNVSFVGYAVVYHGVWSRSPWYFALQPLLATLLLAALCERLARGGLRRWIAVVVAVSLVLVPTRILLGVGRHRPVRSPISGALEALSELPDDALVASWNGGALGYLSGRRFFSLDGLVGSWDYRLSERHDLCGFLRRNRVTHLVDVFRFSEGRALGPVYPGDPGYQNLEACHERLHPRWPSIGTGERTELAILELLW